MHREYQTLMSLLKLLLYFGMAFCLAVSDRRDVEDSENSSRPLEKTDSF
jgi:hypothetical protein